MKILFLDDNKYRITVFLEIFEEASCVMTAHDCISLLKDEDWDIVFLDHDLGGEIFVDSISPDTGYEVVRWILQNKPKIKNIVVHSCNVVAAISMEHELRDFGYNTIRLPFSVDNMKKCHSLVKEGK